MDEAHAAMSTGWPADSMRQATTSTGTNQSTLTTLMSTNGRTKAARYSPLPAGSSIAKDTHMCRCGRVSVGAVGVVLLVDDDPNCDVVSGECGDCQ